MYLKFHPLIILAGLASVHAQNVIEELSFGHKQGISPNSFAIPNWSMLGEGHVPQLLSDKVILTPPYGSNKRGALWTEKKNTAKEWILDFEFRAGAADRGNGNLEIWYVQDGQSVVSTSTLYNAPKFDGLVLVIDNAEGVQKIRGFLNDGTTEYKTHANVDGLAFGHCDYNFRNLGRPSRLQLKSTNNGLELRIDDKECFATNQVTLPSEYTFGMTASSGDPPDSFEVFKFAVSSTISTSSSSSSSEPQFARQPRQHIPAGMMQMDDTPASKYTTNEAQFEDLHNRLNLLSKSISNLFTEVTKLLQTQESNYKDLLSRMPNGQLINNLDQRVANLDRMITSLERELKTSDHNAQFAKLSEQLTKTHEGVTEHVPQRLREYVQAHTPRIGFILYSFMAFQTCCVGAFVWYKYRKSTMPKKYL